MSPRQSGLFRTAIKRDRTAVARLGDGSAGPVSVEICNAPNIAGSTIFGGTSLENRHDFQDKTGCSSLLTLDTISEQTAASCWWKTIPSSSTSQHFLEEIDRSAAGDGATHGLLGEDRRADERGSNRRLSDGSIQVQDVDMGQKV